MWNSECQPQSPWLGAGGPGSSSPKTQLDIIWSDESFSFKKYVSNRILKDAIFKILRCWTLAIGRMCQSSDTWRTWGFCQWLHSFLFLKCLRVVPVHDCVFFYCCSAFHTLTIFITKTGGFNQKVHDISLAENWFSLLLPFTIPPTPTPAHWISGA